MNCRRCFLPRTHRENDRCAAGGDVAAGKDARLAGRAGFGINRDDAVLADFQTRRRLRDERIRPLPNRDDNGVDIENII